MCRPEFLYRLIRKTGKQTREPVLAIYLNRHVVAKHDFHTAAVCFLGHYIDRGRLDLGKEDIDIAFRQ